MSRPDLRRGAQVAQSRGSLQLARYEEWRLNCGAVTTGGQEAKFHCVEGGSERTIGGYRVALGNLGVE